MNTITLKPHVSVALLFRWGAAAMGTALAINWLGLVIVEAVQLRRIVPNTHALQEAIILAFIFCGYALGWRKELAGGVLIILGTVAFFVDALLLVGALPSLGVAWFAVPGVLYVLAWLSNE